MALLHTDATLTPTKDQLVGPWMASRPWWDGESERGPVGKGPRLRVVLPDALELSAGGCDGGERVG